jgi:hypothetical protein
MMMVFGVKMPMIQKPGGIWGYMKGFTGVGKHGKKYAERFVEAANAKDAGALAALFSASNDGIECPAGGQSLDPRAFVNAVPGRISAKDLVSAGQVTAFRFNLESSELDRQGIALFDFSSKKIRRARFFWDSEGEKAKA